MTERAWTNIKRKTKHVVYYDNYWRCDVKECGKCKVVRPVTEFYPNRSKPCGYHAICKPCWRHQSDSLSEAERARRREKHLEWQRRNRDKVNAAQERYRARHKERIAARRKVTRMQWEERLGGSYPVVNYKTIEGCMRRLGQSIRRKYRFPCKPADCFKEFATRNDFRYVFRNWKQSNYERKGAPVVVLKEGIDKPESLADFQIISFGKLKSKSCKKSWKRGVYDTRCFKDSRAKPGTPFPGHVKRRRGSSGGVCGNQAAASVEERGVFMEAEGGTL